MNRIFIPVAFIVAFLVLAGISALWYVSYSRPPEAPPTPVAGLKKSLLKPPTAEELEKLDGHPEQAAAELDRLLLCFNSEELHVTAAELLRQIGADAVDPVAGQLKDPSAKVRYSALLTLGLMGPQAASAVDEVRGCLKDGDAEVRYKAAYALGRFGVKSEKVVGGLASLINDKDETVANHAIEAIEAIGPAAAPVLYAVASAKKDPRRERALALLVKLGPPQKDALPSLADLLTDPSQSIRGNAMRLLGRLGSAAVPALQGALKKADPLDDFDLMNAVAGLGSDAAPLLPDLSSYLANRKFWDAEQDAMIPYRKCDAAGAKALADLLKTLQTKMGNPLDHREMAVLRTLGEMGASGKAAVPVLVEVMNAKEALRSPILQTLGDIGPAAREAAAPAVQALTKDERVGPAARIALKRMGVVEKK